MKTTDQFDAVDQDGNTYRVIEKRKIIDVGDLENRATKLGLPMFSVNGELVNQLSETEFEIIASGKRIYKK
ncbi:MAG: hypothetical protein ACYCXJ_07030 [Thermoleophilia bacterium]